MVDLEANMEKTNDPVDRCFCLRLSFRNVGASDVASAALSDGRHYHASRSRMRSWQDTGCWCLRGQNHQTPSPQASPQVRGVGCRERLRPVVLKPDELDGGGETPPQVCNGTRPAPRSCSTTGCNCRPSAVHRADHARRGPDVRQTRPCSDMLGEEI